MTKPRTGTLTERAPGIWRLQVTADPDPVTGEVRRMSRTVHGTRAQATEDLQRLVVEAGAGLHLGSRVTVAELLAQFMTTATLAPTMREDWTSVIRRHLVPELGAVPLAKLTARDCDGLYVRMAAQGIGPSRVLRSCRAAPRGRPSGPLGLVGPQPGVVRHSTGRAARVDHPA